MLDNCCHGMGNHTELARTFLALPPAPALSLEIALVTNFSRALFLGLGIRTKVVVRSLLAPRMEEVLLNVHARLAMCRLSTLDGLSSLKVGLERALQPLVPITVAEM